MTRPELTDALLHATNAPGTNLAEAALVVARIEYPRLDPEPYLTRLDAMGEAARRIVERHTRTASDASVLGCIAALNEFLFDDLGFAGNQDKYEDPRNSCLNEVLDRRTGIPITLSLVFIEVARRAGIRAEGVNFPGHFLVRCPEAGDRGGTGIIVDPFHKGTLLTERDCRLLFKRHAGSAMAFGRSLLAPATRTQVVVRMLLNLKRLYVNMRSFPQALQAIELLLALTPSALTELRDRGLLAYQLNDVNGALADLQTYLKLSSLGDVDSETRDEHVQLWEHVKTLRRRVAELN